MKPTATESQKEFAKLLTAACVRRGHLEELHLGITPVTRTGDYSDVKVIGADGKVIPWTEVSRINQDEMKALMIGVVNRVHTFLARTLFSNEDKVFEEALKRTTVPWVKGWDEPKYLPDFLMPVTPKKKCNRPTEHPLTQGKATW